MPAQKSIITICKACTKSSKTLFLPSRVFLSSHSFHTTTRSLSTFDDDENKIIKSSSFKQQDAKKNKKVFKGNKWKGQTTRLPNYLKYSGCNILNLVKPLFKPDDLEPEEEDYVYVSVADFGEELSRYEDLTDLIPDKQSITVEYDYPLSVPARKTFERPSPNGFTQRELIRLICEGYEEIYKEEEESSTITAQPLREKNPNSSLINRCSTNGKYGIWGHDIEDLILRELMYDSSQDIFSIGVDS